jgi:Family of unknown function (DUF6152)
MRNRLFTFAAAVVFLTATPAFSHHAFAGEFDSTKPVTLEGVVTRIDWENPHVYFYVEVTDSNGTTASWKCETRGPKGLESRGWKRDSLKVGDRVIVHGSLARNGSHMADGREVTLADGRKILSGTNN